MAKLLTRLEALERISNATKVVPLGLAHFYGYREGDELPDDLQRWIDATAGAKTLGEFYAGAAKLDLPRSSQLNSKGDYS